ncbi:MAG: hypothetical protein ACR2RB_10160 [Gammaproteobacteria bacterium]
MSEIHVSITVTNLLGDHNTKLELDEARVDTGASDMLTLTEEDYKALGAVTGPRWIRAVHLADGTVLADGAFMEGPYLIHVEDFEPFGGDIMFIRAPGPEFEPLLGHVSMEQAGLMVDMKHGTLRPIEAVNLRGYRRRS